MVDDAPATEPRSEAVAVAADLVERNRRYAEVSHRPGLPAAPARHLAVVACMDARIDVLPVLGLDLGDVHVIRNAGGIVTHDVLRSLLLSQRSLGTRGVILVHHTRCGVHGLDEAAFTAALEAEAGSAPPFPLHAFDDVAEDVRRSAERIRTCPWLPHRDVVRGFVYDVDSGLLEEIA